MIEYNDIVEELARELDLPQEEVDAKMKHLIMWGVEVEEAEEVIRRNHGS